MCCRCCSGSKDEEDFRPLFDNFVQDLLVTLHLPEWPAAELLLMLMGGLLVSVCVCVCVHVYCVCICACVLCVHVCIRTHVCVVVPVQCIDTGVI